jgi:hypothetical protein
MVPAEPCVFEISRGYRNDVRVEIAATIRNRLIVAIHQPELRVALGRWRACWRFRCPTAGRRPEFLFAVLSPFFGSGPPSVWLVACVLNVTPA